MFETRKGWGYQVEEAVAGREGVSAQWEEPLGLNLCQALGLNSSSVWLLTSHQLSLSLVFSRIVRGSVRDKATWLVRHGPHLNVWFTLRWFAWELGSLFPNTSAKLLPQGPLH